MSNKSCNKCVIGKVDAEGSEEFCKKCILHSEFSRSRTGTRILTTRPGIKDDRV